MIERMRAEGCASDLAFDAWAASELDADAVAGLERHLVACERCRARRAQHEDARAAFLQRMPTLHALGDHLGARKAVPSKHWRRRVWLGAAGASVLACAAAALLVLRPEAASPGTRSKGAPHLGLFIKHEGRITRGEPGAVVSEGDLVRFTYSSDHDAYLAVLNVDARSATSYFPAQAGQAQQVRGGSDVALGFSVELDAVPGTERVLGVFCREPFDVRPLLAALEDSGKLPVLPGCHVDELHLRKTPPP